MKQNNKNVGGLNIIQQKLQNKGTGVAKLKIKIEKMQVMSHFMFTTDKKTEIRIEKQFFLMSFL